MAKRKSMKGDVCPVARALDVVGDHWSMLIVRDAFDGARRFGDFHRSLGMARNILADRLRMLVGEGVLVATADENGGSYLRYLLTPKGKDLFLVLVALEQWGGQHLFEPDEQHSRLVDRDTGQDLCPVQVRTRDGELLEPGRAVVRKMGLARGDELTQ